MKVKLISTHTRSVFASVLCSIILCSLEVSSNIDTNNVPLDLNLHSIRVIWDKGAHNAFTDLIFFQEHFYCVFREAETHRSMDGVIRVIKSADMENWESVAVIDMENADLRDPKLAINNEDKLLLIAYARYIERQNNVIRESFSWLSDDGEHWSDPYSCETGLSTWRWSLSWGLGASYSVAYTSKDKNGTLYATEDGKKWEVVVSDFFPEVESYPNEASLVFNDTDSIAYCLLRRDKGSQTAFLGQSSFPFVHWEWTDLGKRIGGPKMIQLSNGQLLAVVRLYDGRVRTSVCLIDPKDKKISEALTLPSGGDTSYAGVVEKNGRIYVSYYSSHEKKSKIYFAIIAY